MTREEYAAAAVVPTRTEDWGSSSGQGRRSGASVIRLMEDEDKRVAIGAIQGGLSVHDALVIAYGEEPVSAAVAAGEGE